MYLGFKMSRYFMKKRGITISKLKDDLAAHENRHKNRDNSVWCQDPGACVHCDRENAECRAEALKHHNRVFNQAGEVCEGFPDCLRCEKARDF